MKRLTIVFLLISLATFGQDTASSNKSTKFNRLLFGVSVSPDYCYRTLHNNDGSSISTLVMDVRNESEVFKIGYTTGLTVCYNISKNLGMESGVLVSNKGYATEESDLTFGDAIDPRYGFVYGSNNSNGGYPPTRAQMIYNYFYLEVPIRVIFSFGQSRIHFVSSIGLTTGIFLEATQTMILYGEETRKKTIDPGYDFNSFNFSPTVSVGLDYRISKRINLRAEPTFRYGLLKIIDAPVTANLWSGGLNVTGYYVFK